jgi:hypothetical protein
MVNRSGWEFEIISNSLPINALKNFREVADRQVTVSPWGQHKPTSSRLSIGKKSISFTGGVEAKWIIDPSPLAYPF